MTAVLNRMLGAALAASSIAGALLLGGCTSQSASPAQRGEEKPRPVEAVRAQLEPLERTVRSFGSLSAHEQATLSTKVPGRLASLAVDLGAVVRQGDVIAQIDPQDYKLEVQQAEALLAQARVRLGLPLEGENDAVDPDKTSVVRQTRAVLEEARAHRDRVASLSAQKIISKSELETAEANFEVALSKHEDALQETRTRQALLAQRRAELRIARQFLEDTTIRAPFVGAVQERRANPGEYLPASAPIVTLVRIDLLRLRLEVPEREASKIAVDQKVRLTLQGTTNIYEGEIKRLSPALDERSRMLRVEADVPNPGSLRPGAFVSADIVVNPRALVVMVPARAIITFAGLEKVFVSESGRALEKSIVTGQRLGDSVEVVSGLKAGESVISNPGNLQNGQAVTIMASPESPHKERSRSGTEENSG